MRRGESRRGVSLVELLVVLLIILILIALGVPQLRRVRESARSVVCLTNLRTWGQATFFYMNDNKERLPLAIEQVDLRSGRAAPLDVLSPILSLGLPAREGDSFAARPPFRCPSDAAMASRIGFSYRYVPADWMGIPYMWKPEPQKGVSDMYAQSPTDLAVFADLDSFHGKGFNSVTYGQVVRREPYKE